jgi:hypothetical protein
LIAANAQYSVVIASSSLSSFSNNNVGNSQGSMQGYFINILGSNASFT